VQQARYQRLIGKSLLERTLLDRLQILGRNPNVQPSILLDRLGVASVLPLGSLRRPRTSPLAALRSRPTSFPSASQPGRTSLNRRRVRTFLKSVRWTLSGAPEAVRTTSSPHTDTQNLQLTSVGFASDSSRRRHDSNRWCRDQGWHGWLGAGPCSSPWAIGLSARARPGCPSPVRQVRQRLSSVRCSIASASPATTTS
jgi:hypothetical protein